jgi:hypothetical protein
MGGGKMKRNWKEDMADLLLRVMLAIAVFAMMWLAFRLGWKFGGLIFGGK